MTLHVFGIRHHGPGCARALRVALESLAPDVVLVEGPADATEALECVAHEGMVPPVALLSYAVDDPQTSSFYPFAEFSPEWQALRYGAERNLAIRFMDLPSTHTLALRSRASETAPGDGDDHAPDGGGPPVPLDDAEPSDAIREDPIGSLAAAAGFNDHEQWWDLQVEQRRDAAGLFEGILEAMTVLRETHVERRLLELHREAYMRGVIRATLKEGFQRVAVVCGAWHAPALYTLGSAMADAELLKGLPKVKVAATWVPWTYSRLSFRSGYGAGVDSPGWYEHVWTYRQKAPVVWATLAARLLRGQDLDASAANVIETVRLSDALASMRELPAPGLAELREAIESVLCGGERARLALIRSRLEIGDALGAVPAQANQVPLMLDFRQQVKRLRLKLSAEPQQLELDLRKDNDRERSRLLHRLRVLGVEWGRTVALSKGSGTFKEGWQVVWGPELEVELISANIHGNTIESAAGRALSERAEAADLPELSRLVEVAIVSQLPPALDALLVELDARAASSSDVRLQMKSLAPLARLVRYSDVRETRAEQLLPVLKGIFERVLVGMPLACTLLDDAAAGQMVDAIGQAHVATLLLDDALLKTEWLLALHKLLDAGTVHPRIRGRVCRLLLEQRALVEGEVARRASLALSPSVEAAEAAQWVEGLVAGDGLLLVHQEELLATLDAWLSGLGADVFQAQLPLLRRAFSGLAAPERRAVAQRVKRAQTAGARGAVEQRASADFDEGKVSQLLPVLAQILGVNHV